MDSTDRVAAISQRQLEDWLSRQMSGLIEPDLFLRAYGNDECKKTVAFELAKLGFDLAFHPSGKVELRKDGKTVSVYESA